MTKFIRVAIAPLALAAALGACGPKDQPTPESRQVELTPNAVGQPQLGDTALASAPAPVAKPATKPATRSANRPASTTGVVSGGLSLGTTLGTRVCTNTHKVGDQVTATLAGAVPGTNGASIPAGATVTLRVSESQRGENGKEGIRLALEPVSVTFGGSTYAIDGSATPANIASVRAQSSGDQAKKVATGAVVGAIAGQIIGKRAKTAAIGAAVGAAAGGAVAVGAADWNGCVADGGTVTVTLRSPVTVKVVAGRSGS